MFLYFLIYFLMYSRYPRFVVVLYRVLIFLFFFHRSRFGCGFSRGLAAALFPILAGLPKWEISQRLPLLQVVK